ncbi:MAG: PQQ-binding-like beta-propeller repeat protein [Holosporaceae bacterium]|jgi:outer membrane protein assembly factor BamB|nr:PQQ-binding-like beta-propeller repeat protein [Holosporaceae bacterium]
MKKKSIVLLSTLGLILNGCSSKDVLKGVREDVIASEIDEEIIKKKDSTPVVEDQRVESNSQFLQPHFNASHCYPPLQFSVTSSVAEYWRSKLDFETTPALRMAASPIVAEGKVFCIDAGGIVYAFDQQNGKRLWRKSITIAGKDGQIGGAIAYEGGRLVVTSSFAEGFSLDAKDGKILWRIKLPAPCKGDGITIHNGKAFVMCSNSSLHCIDINSGKILWSHAGMTADSTFLGCTAAAVDDGVVYFAYPSGEVYALLEETGAALWDAMLSKFSITNTASAFSHPRACPVVKDGVVYFVSANAQTSAFDVKNGKLLWRNDFGGVQTPIVSGNSIFILNSKSEVVCLNKETGNKRWSAKLTEDTKEIADWYGMILVKDHLLMVAPRRRMICLSLGDGKIKKTIDMNDGWDRVSVNPVVANGVLYILMDCGRIVAYK